MKILVTIVDGMRPDALIKTENAKQLLENSNYTLNARTVTPSVTLPCHMSLFHSVDPERHGTTINLYAPQVRPVRGLCEVLRAQRKKSAMFYSWEELRDLTRPGTLSYAHFIQGATYGYEEANSMLTDEAIEFYRCDNY